MPSKSKAQSRFFHLLENIKSGKAGNASPEAREAAEGMSGESISHFTDTPRKGLPERKTDKTTNKKAKMEKEGEMRAMENLREWMGKVAQSAVGQTPLGKAFNIGQEPQMRTTPPFINPTSNPTAGLKGKVYDAGMLPETEALNKQYAAKKNTQAQSVVAAPPPLSPRGAEDQRLFNICKQASQFLPEPEINSPMAFYRGYMDKEASEGERIERYVLAHPEEVPSSAIAGALMKAAGEDAMDADRLQVVETLVNGIRKQAAEGSGDESSAAARILADIGDFRAGGAALRSDISQMERDYMRRRGVVEAMRKRLRTGLVGMRDVAKGDAPLLTMDEEGRDRARRWFLEQYADGAAKRNETGRNVA